jgi:hypothetical protein
MSDLAKFAGQCAAFSGEMVKAEKVGVRKVALGLTTVVRARTNAVASGGRLSGVGRRGAKIGAKYEILGNGTAIVKATGPYQLIERDTAGHGEPRGSRRKKRVLSIPGVGFRRSVHHPGTRGKHTFERAVAEWAPEAPRVFQREVAAGITRAFR